MSIIRVSNEHYGTGTTKCLYENRNILTRAGQASHSHGPWAVIAASNLETG